LTVVTVAGLLKTRNIPSRAESAESADIADLVSTAGSADTQQVQIARHGR
jgi:hypothetical protein